MGLRSGLRGLRRQGLYCVPPRRHRNATILSSSRHRPARASQSFADGLPAAADRPKRLRHGFNHCFATWFILRQMQPELVVESGRVARAIHLAHRTGSAPCGDRGDRSTARGPRADKPPRTLRDRRLFATRLVQGKHRRSGRFLRRPSECLCASRRCTGSDFAMPSSKIITRVEKAIAIHSGTSRRALAPPPPDEPG